MPGFERGRNLDKIGLHAQDTAELFFTDVRVPGRTCSATEGSGFGQLMRNLPQERLTIAVSAVTGAERRLAWTLEYAGERKAFGRPIGTFQHNRFLLAEMRHRGRHGAGLRRPLHRGARAGELTAADAAKAKWWTTELQWRVLDRCLQLHGGYGYMDEYPIARA